MQPTMLALSLAGALAGSTAIAAADGAPADPGVSTASVATAPALQAGDTAPFDVPGVKAIRRGKTIPTGYVLPGYAITVHNGDTAIGPSFWASCPKGKTLRSFATTGDAGFGAITENYPGKRRAFISSFRGRPASGVNDTAGTIYAVCR